MSDDVVDLTDVLERVQDDKELLMELFEIFEEDFKVKRKQLDELLAGEASDQVKDVVHSIRGAAGNIAAKVIFATCTTMEQAAESGDLESVRKLLPNLDEQFKAFEQFYARMKDK